MAKFLKGILGGFSGLLGTVVGSRWKNIDTMRSRPTVTKGRSTNSQQIQRARFLTASNFIGSMKALFPVSYHEKTGKMTHVNSALSNIIKSAVTGEFPDFHIDYSMALVASGGIPNAAAVVPAVAGDASVVNFQWSDNTGTGAAKATDKAILVAFCEELNHSAYTVGDAVRSDGKASLSLLSFKGKQVHTWLAFAAANGKDTATSIYTGSVLVS